MISTIRIGQGPARGAAIITAATPNLPAGIVSVYLGADAGGEAVLRMTPNEAALFAGEVDRAARAAQRAEEAARAAAAECCNGNCNQGRTCPARA